MKKIAIYPGTFDPITNGHVDLIQRASKIFDEVVVLVSADTKKKPMFSTEERSAMVSEAVDDYSDNVKVKVFHGLLVEEVKRLSACIIIRGLRAVSDFEYESQMALMNKRLNPLVETFFMISREEYAYISSSFVKEISNLGGDVSTMVPEGVARKLNRGV
ncbi:pantetheine-phosphate adenylyltransferase [bacterium]|nr:MAG: pantetheine-phosphate adenylyltransferase [bacterium]